MFSPRRPRVPKARIVKELQDIGYGLAVFLVFAGITFVMRWLMGR